MSTANTLQQIQIRPRVVCPHCWNNFASEETLWVAQHDDLRNDPQLGPEAQQRFLPTRFNVEGDALDSRGAVCQGLACPRCHLTVPRAMYEMGPLFVSIMGTPSCGKSYYLSSLTWALRRSLPSHFQISFTDADPQSNLLLNRYEELQFFNSDPNAIVKLEKTQEHGDLYDAVRYGDQVVQYPRPFLFSMSPLPSHPSFGKASQVARVLCMYDNAGESFQPGKDTTSSPVTRHLAHSQAILFLFDPTQDPRFREACQRLTNDPQMRRGSGAGVVYRQDVVLNEAADRVRKYSGLKHGERHSKPLIVVVTKLDAWAGLLSKTFEDLPLKSFAVGDVKALDSHYVMAVSKKVRELLWKYSPEIVSSAEGFAKDVIYVPVSATGCSPQVDAATGRILGIRPKDIRPIWVDVPLLMVLAKWCKGLVPYTGYVQSTEK